MYDDTDFSIHDSNREDQSIPMTGPAATGSGMGNECEGNLNTCQQDSVPPGLAWSYSQPAPAVPAPVDQSPEPIITQTEQFLELLDEDAERFTFQTFDDTKGKRRELVRVLHGTIKQHKAELTALNQAGAGIFVTINETDLSGRLAQNIVRVRAFFVDLDGAPLEPVMSGPLSPHIVVESGTAGRYHAYWLVSDVPIEHFTGVQKHLIGRYGADSVVHDLPRVMRLPGFWHCKAEPVMTRVIDDSGEQPYTFDEFIQAFGIDLSAPAPQAPAVAPVVRTEPGEVTPAVLVEVRKLAISLALKTHDDARIGRHGEVYKGGSYMRRDGLPLTPETAATFLKTFEENMRPTDTAGVICGLNWDAEMKTLNDGYYRPSERDQPGTTKAEAKAIAAGLAAANGMVIDPETGEILDGAGDEPDLAGNSGTVDSAATPISDAMKEATLSARRASLKGEPMNLIARRIVKQWPWLRDHADEIAQRAFNWAKKLEPGNTIELSGITRRITSLEILNRKFGMLEAPGQQTCIIHRPDGLPVSDKDFRSRIESDVVIVGVDSKGQPQCVDASRAWKQSANKHTFNRIRFTAKPVLESDYNLFTGFGCKPIEGDCSLILRHIYEVICGSDTATYEAFLNLLAWQFQNVGRPSRIITTLYSEEQQIGKGIFLEHVLVPMAGLHGFMSSNVEHGFSRFNDALRGKFIVFLDEASFAGDRKLADKLKSTAGTENMPIEGKGVPIINMPAGINLFMATNHMHSANVERIDARYWILRVSPCHKGDFQYFTALRDQIENGGREAFLHLLLTHDVSNFIPQRDIPRENEMLEVNREMSLAAGHPAHWLRECIEYSALRGAVENGIDRPWMTGSEIGGSILHDAYRYWVKNIKAIHVTEVTMSAFWKFMTAMGFEKGSKSRNRARLIPSMEICSVKLKDFMAGRISLDSPA